jgi:hypothetical protein
MEGGCTASSGELVRVGILGDVGSQFPTLVHQGSKSFQSLVVRYVVLFPISYMIFYTHIKRDALACFEC